MHMGRGPFLATWQCEYPREFWLLLGARYKNKKERKKKGSSGAWGGFSRSSRSPWLLKRKKRSRPPGSKTVVQVHQAKPCLQIAKGHLPPPLGNEHYRNGELEISTTSCSNETACIDPCHKWRAQSRNKIALDHAQFLTENDRIPQIREDMSHAKPMQPLTHEVAFNPDHICWGGQALEVRQEQVRTMLVAKGAECGKAIYQAQQQGNF
ncbi:hypothetical protein VNO77_42119 [Canavalia gladiata]|uniref:Uncharacterized protein n=1 Tax=Canavalia gladiata TaxID=3824 RepID=A0AAN9PS50_CANGL